MTDDGTFYYVMEYLPGWTLQELVAQHGPLPPARAAHLLRQTCAALREAHAHGLIHRDIKPGNLMVCERGGVFDVLKLMDFGLVRPLAEAEGPDPATRRGMFLGTPLYVSPEQASGRKTLDGRSDLYSLGAVAYFLLTGQPPFTSHSVMEVLTAHLRDLPKPLSDLRADVPRDLEQVVLRCLEKDPGQRYPNADGLNRALSQCSCAGQWTQDEAAAWWQKHGRNIPEGNSAEADPYETRIDARN